MRENKDTEERRSEFVEAAEKLFKENGVVDTTINAIVKEMDVAKGLFYYYFKSKDDVIEAISDKYNNDFKQTIQRSMNPDDDFDERLNIFLENTIKCFRKIVDNFQGANEDIDLSILSSRSIDEAKETASQALKELFKEGNETEQLNVPSPDYYADLIIGGIADLVSHTEADMNEIMKMIQDLIKRSGKEN